VALLPIYVKKIELLPIMKDESNSHSNMQAPTRTQTALFANEKNGLVKINNDSTVEARLRAGNTYYMYLPKTDELLYLQCTLVAIRGADMKILKHTKGGSVVTNDLNCTFGYHFANYDTVNFASFSYQEPCELYVHQKVYIPEEPLESLFLDDAPK